jgi:hypothetical protein
MPTTRKTTARRVVIADMIDAQVGTSSHSMTGEVRNDAVRPEGGDRVDDGDGADRRSVCYHGGSDGNAQKDQSHVTDIDQRLTALEFTSGEPETVDPLALARAVATQGELRRLARRELATRIGHTSTRKAPLPGPLPWAILGSNELRLLGSQWLSRHRYSRHARLRALAGPPTFSRPAAWNQT